jgi:cohesin loading factor subunit SCC2
VLLLQNAGLKSKDISARCLAIDLLGNIAAQLKRDAVTCTRNKFWILQELDAKTTNPANQKGACSVCQGRRGINISCDACGRCFHWDCMGIGSHENYLRDDWSCHLCLSKMQIGVLQSYHKLHESGGAKRKGKAITGDTVTQFEAVQQILLSYLQEAGQQDDGNLFTRWYVICVTYLYHCMTSIIFCCCFCTLQNLCFWNLCSLFLEDSPDCLV